ncbi:MAG: F0F1 ATP synthase subunit B [Magnetococcus sp. WYHC-3]
MDITATLFGQMLTFAVLVWFIRRVLWNPLTRLMAERQERIAQGLKAAEHGREQEELAERRATERLREARREASDLIVLAHIRAKQITDAAHAEARRESSRLLGAAREEIALEARQAREVLRAELSALVLVGVERVLRREVDAAAHAEILDQLTAEL